MLLFHRDSSMRLEQMVSTIKAHFLHEPESIFQANQLLCCHVVMQSSLMAIHNLPLMLRPKHSSPWQGHKYKKYSKESFTTNLFSLVFVQAKTMTRELGGSGVYWENPSCAIRCCDPKELNWNTTCWQQERMFCFEHWHLGGNTSETTEQLLLSGGLEGVVTLPSDQPQLFSNHEEADSRIIQRH